MNTKFARKLYVFAKEFDPKFKEIFGEEKLKLIDLTKLDNLDETVPNALFKVADYYFSNCDTLTIVEDYEDSELTFLLISGFSSKVFRVDSTDDENDFITLSQMVENLKDLERNHESFAYTMDVLVEDAEMVLDQSEHNELYDIFSDIQANFSYFEDLLLDHMKYKISTMQLGNH